MGIAPVDGIVSPAYYVYDLDISNRLFGQALLRSKPYVAHLGQASDGVRVGQWDLTISGMRAIPVLIPPPAEQAAIARFLDWASGRLERTIRAKRKLIALLNEQKQAIIHRAVTRGLDPSVPLKPSGIPWLGEIPEHWEVMAVKHVLQRLVDCEHKTAPYVEQSDFRVVRTSAVRNGEIRWNGTYCTTADAFAEWTQRATPEAGDVIFTREAPAGEACLVPERPQVCLGQRTVLMKVRTWMYDSKFLIHMIYVGPPRLCIDLASQGSTVGHFNMDDISWIKVLAPPLHEQHQIVDSISKETVDLRLTIERTEQEIDLLREYRTRLVADVVTGKLDVREAATRLPDEELLPDLAAAVDETEDLPIDDEANA
jgi:type I restriction enzyme S subunit